MNTLVLLSLEAISLNECCAISQVLSGQSPVRSWSLLTSVFSSPQLWFMSFASLRLHTTNFLFVTYPHYCPASSVLAHPCPAYCFLWERVPKHKSDVTLRRQKKFDSTFPALLLKLFLELVISVPLFLKL